MTAKNMLMAASTGSSSTYVDDVFSTVIRSGTSATATVTTGFQPDLVWTKCRGTTARNHFLFDSQRGATIGISSNTTGVNTTYATDLTAFTSTGFTLGAGSNTNSSADTYVDWVFKKAPKFFDVVTYTGTGVARTVNHGLEQLPGMIIVKGVSAGASGTAWRVWHRSLTSSAYKMDLNTTSGSGIDNTVWNSTSPTTATFTVGTDTSANASGETYVAYLFAHDVSTDGIIQCGTYTTDGSGNATVSLGWEPQYLLVKATTATDDWRLVDSMRQFSRNGSWTLSANTSTTEGGSTNIFPNASGFDVVQAASTTFIYVAIRRQNKPPTTGTQVYNAIARTGTGATANITGVGFSPDLVIAQQRSGAAGAIDYDKYRGATYSLLPYSTSAEVQRSSGLTSFNMDGFSVGADSVSGQINQNAQTIINWCFKRNPGIFDVVCYAGTSSSATTSHNLGAVPELIISKRRDLSGSWRVYCSYLASATDKYLTLNATDAVVTSAGFWPSTSISNFGLGNFDNNSAGGNYVAYLFASSSGISKVGSYTGNGSSLTVNAGFSTGARFVMIKRTDSTGDWYVWDSVRGIVAANDPHLSLNTTAAEVTTNDSIDPDTSGFIVNQVAATNINVNAASYIYLALA